MKAILQSELALIKTMAPSLVIIFTVVGIFMCWASGSPATACAICAMWPMLLLFSLTGYDATNGWERYRTALPFSRHDIVAGRYASVLLSSLAVAAFACLIGMLTNVALPLLVPDFGTATLPQMIGACLVATFFMLALVACLQPFIVKFGYTKGLRAAACFFILAVCLGVVLLEEFASPELLDSIFMWIDANAALLVATIVLLGAAIYAASCAISMRIAQKKDL